MWEGISFPLMVQPGLYMFTNYFIHVHWYHLHYTIKEHYSFKWNCTAMAHGHQLLFNEHQPNTCCWFQIAQEELIIFVGVTFHVVPDRTTISNASCMSQGDESLEIGCPNCDLFQFVQRIDGLLFVVYLFPFYNDITSFSVELAIVKHVHYFRPNRSYLEKKIFPSYCFDRACEKWQ